jgi:signal peptidase I
VKRKTFVWIAVGILFIAVQVLFTYAGAVLKVHPVPTGAMSPTIKPGDYVLVQRTKDVAVGDIITFRYPVDPKVLFIKRFVATGGNTVEIRDKQLLINGREVLEPYVQHDPQFDGSRDPFGPYVVPAGHSFVLGDNRDHSNDSRYWGSVPAANVTGRAILIYSPKGGPRVPPRTPPAPSPAR